MNILIAVAAGGAFGAVCRHLISSSMTQALGHGFPYGTLCVNVLGSFMMGVLIQVFAQVWSPGQAVQAMLTVGFLGALTTFSAFSMDTVTLFERGAYGAMAMYMMLSVILSVGALFAALTLGRVVMS